MELNLDNSMGGFGDMQSGWSGFDGFSGELVQSSGTGAESGGFLSGLWSGTTDFLRDGLDVWQDYLQIEAAAQQVGHTNTPPVTQWTETVPPVDAAPTNPVVTPAPWVPGVSNSTVLIGGGLLLAVLLLGGRR